MLTAPSTGVLRHQQRALRDADVGVRLLLLQLHEVLGLQHQQLEEPARRVQASLARRELLQPDAVRGRSGALWAGRLEFGAAQGTITVCRCEGTEIKDLFSQYITITRHLRWVIHGNVAPPFSPAERAASVGLYPDTQNLHYVVYHA